MKINNDKIINFIISTIAKIPSLLYDKDELIAQICKRFTIGKKKAENLYIKAVEKLKQRSNIRILTLEKELLIEFINQRLARLINKNGIADSIILQYLKIKINLLGLEDQIPVNVNYSIDWDKVNKIIKTLKNEN